MNLYDRYYSTGMSSVLASAGLTKKAASQVAEAVTEIQKKASLFNFSDSNDNSSGFRLSSIVVPLIAASLAGYISYNARDKGLGSRSAFENIKNYLAGTVDKYTRKARPRPIYDIDRYINS